MEDLNIYCIAHAIRENDWAHGKLRELRSILDKNRITTTSPKLGNHVTLIPPFRTTEAAAKLLAWGLDYWDTVRLGSVQEHDKYFGAIATGFEFFEGDEGDAFIVQLRVDSHLTRAVERGRKKIPEIAEWVHIKNYDFNPHITVAEGKGLAESVRRLISTGKLPRHYMDSFSISFEVPRVFRKNLLMHRWEPVG